MTDAVSEVRLKLDSLKASFGFNEPDRGNLDDPSIKWRHGKPNYDKANYEFCKGKKMNHKAGSLNQLVEDLVKTWEMEASHKLDLSQWTSVNGTYKLSANGGRVYCGEEAKSAGNYNVLLDGCRKELYDSSVETFDTSHDLFRGTFTDGFPWEVIEVFSGPPRVTFSWRHWGRFTGTYRGNVGAGQTVEMYGFACVNVSASLKIEDIEVYYKPNEFLEVLEGKRPNADIANGSHLVGPACPFIERSVVSQ